MTRRDGAEGVLRNAVHGSRQIVKEQNQADLSVLMLMCRRHEKDYLLRSDENYIEDVSKRIAQFKQRGYPRPRCPRSSPRP